MWEKTDGFPLCHFLAFEECKGGMFTSLLVGGDLSSRNKGGYKLAVGT